MERHQSIAILIFCASTLVIWLMDGREEALLDGAIMFMPLLLILIYRLIARLAGFGIPEIFAKDYGSVNHPGPYAFLFWVLFIVVCLFCLFDLSLY